MLRHADRELRRNRTVYAALGALILVGVAARLYMGYTWPIDLDEGLYLYDAKVALQGPRPAFDFNSRSPLYHYFLGYVMEVFGYSLVVARSFVIGTSAVTAVFIYLIGRDLFDDVVGVGAAAVFMLSPYFAYWNHIIKTEPFALMSAAILYWMFLRSLEFVENRFRLFLGCTFVVGTIISLNHMIRASVLLYIPSLFVLLVYRLRSDEELDIDQVEVVASFAAVLLASYVVSKTAFALAFGYPLEFALIQYRNPVAYGLEHLGVFRSATSGAEGAADVGFVATEYSKTRVVFDWLLMAAHVAIPAACGLIVLFYRETERERELLIGSFLLPIGGIALLVAGGATPQLGGYNTTNMSSSQQALLFLLASAVLMSLAFILARAEELSATERTADTDYLFGLLVLMLPAGTLMVFYLLKTRLFVGYFVEFAIPLSILASITFTSLVRSVRASLREGHRHAVTTTLICLLVVSSATFSLVVYADPSATTSDRRLSQQSVGEAADYVQSNSDRSEEILTGQPVIAIEANRRNAMDLSRTFNTYPRSPTPEELVQYMETTDVKFIVVMPNTYSELMGEMGTYIGDHYVLVVTIEDDTAGIDKQIRILRRKEG